jgi:acyl-CoA synthetase (AMP-forming)/AMP-acid ligase II
VIPGGPSSIVDVLAGALARSPDSEALVTNRSRLTYADLDRLANRAAHALASLGHRPGERLGVCLPNDAEIVVAFHGAMRAGAIWVGVNQALAPPEQAYILADAGVTTLLAGPATEAALMPLRGDLPDLRRVVVCDGPTDEWARLFGGSADDPPGIARDPHGPAGIAYTSGTTGFPKGVVHSDHNLLLPGAAIVADRGYRPGYRKGDFLPLTILNMIVLTTLLTAQAEGCSVIADRRDPGFLAGWFGRESIETFTAPPPVYQSLVEDPEVTAHHLAGVRELFAGGAPCPEPLRARFRERFGMELLGSYGLTEAPTAVAFDAVGQHRPGASGRVLPHLDVYAVDPAGSRLPPGTDGEVCIAPTPDGPWAGVYTPMLGYLGRPDATGAALVGDRLRTGDVGSVDADGFLTLHDRLSEMILRGGANVYPAEVERVLLLHPAVAAAVVLGTPDERLGERVVAVVQPVAGATPTEPELRALCLEHLARYKVPDRVDLLDDLPRNAMGKVVRAALADRFR